MRVLTLGGTRFMGRLLVERLLARGDDVTILTRGLTPDPFGDRVERITANRFFVHQLRQSLESAGQWDAAVDFLGVHPGACEGAVACLSGRIDHFVHVSTSAVYEVVLHPDGGPFVETDFALPLDPHTLTDLSAGEYAFNKRRAEETLTLARDRDGFPVTIVRPAFVEGAWDYTLRTWRYALWLRSGAAIDLPDGGGQRVSHTYRNDVVAAILACLDAGSVAIGHVFNVGQDEHMTLRHYLERLAAVLGIPVRFRDRPAAEFTPGTPMYDWHGFMVWDRDEMTLDCAKARAELGWTPTPTDTWLAETRDWFDGPENPFNEPANPPWLAH